MIFWIHRLFAFRPAASCAAACLFTFPSVIFSLCFENDWFGCFGDLFFFIYSLLFILYYLLFILFFRLHP